MPTKTEAGNQAGPIEDDGLRANRGSAGQAKLLEGAAATFSLAAPQERIEVYDDGRIMGANAYGMMIVGGPVRKFRSRIASSDDFAMMREGLQRRFGRALKEDAEAPAMTGEGHAVRRGRVHISPHPA